MGVHSVGPVVFESVSNVTATPSVELGTQRMYLGEIYESFEQWKNIFILICSCKELIRKREKLFCDFIIDVL